jgi:hypothetical protein
MLGGWAWEAFILLRSLAPATLGPSRPLVGLVILLVAGLGAMQSSRTAVSLAAVWCLVFYLFFSWYIPIAAGDRFWAPLVPILLSFAARGAIALFASDAAASQAAVGRRIVWASSLWFLTCTMLGFAS